MEEDIKICHICGRVQEYGKAPIRIISVGDVDISISTYMYVCLVCGEKTMSAEASAKLLKLYKRIKIALED